MKHIGFTGTREGMTVAQRSALRQLITECYFHHGDCIGADAQAQEIALRSKCKVIIHPPDKAALRAYCKGWTNRCQPLPYLLRNEAIVECTELLIAAPESDSEVLRSGTWATIRYARKWRMIICGTRIVQLLRDGGTKEL